MFSIISKELAMSKAWLSFSLWKKERNSNLLQRMEGPLETL